MTDPVDVVLDANVYVDAAAHSDISVLADGDGISAIPSLPPRTAHPTLHVLGVIRDSRADQPQFVLSVSDHILTMVVRAMLRQGHPRTTSSSTWPWRWTLRSSCPTTRTS